VRKETQGLQAPNTKYQAPSNKHQATSTKF